MSWQQLAKVGSIDLIRQKGELYIFCRCSCRANLVYLHPQEGTGTPPQRWKVSQHEGPATFRLCPGTGRVFEFTDYEWRAVLREFAKDPRIHYFRET